MGGERWGGPKSRGGVECSHPVSGFLRKGSFELSGLCAKGLGTHLYGTEEIKKPEGGKNPCSFRVGLCEVVKKELLASFPSCKSGQRPGEAGKLFHTASLSADRLCSGPAGGQGATCKACPRSHGLAI